MSHNMPDVQTIHPEIRYSVTSSLKEADNYFEWIISRIHPFLGHVVLDLGSGYGTHLPFILSYADKLTAMDISAEAVDSLNERFLNYTQFRAVCADFEQSPHPAWMKVSGFDTIVCLDLLEHSSDDISTLRRINALLPAGEGMLILKVPAHPELYGSLDKQAGHFRRYRKSEIATRLEQTGFKIRHIEYFNRLGILFWWLNGRIFKKRLNSRSMNRNVKLFDKLLVPIIKFTESLLPLPFGLSMLVVAVKQRESR